MVAGDCEQHGGQTAEFPVSRQARGAHANAFVGLVNQFGNAGEVPGRFGVSQSGRFAQRGQRAHGRGIIEATRQYLIEEVPELIGAAGLANQLNRAAGAVARNGF